MNNISNIKNCYGCGVCAKACAKQIINIHLNADGFYEPYITETSKCTDCGLCVDVCSYSHDDLALKADVEPVAYGAWSKDYRVRRKCSSGGVGFELGLQALKEDMKVCGVRYNVEDERAEHYIATTPEELIPSIGSKYIQSYTVDGFKAVNRKEKYLITGTPCQIDSFRRYAQKFRCEDNFIFMDFFCHGVPSMLLWKKYIKEKQEQVGKITYVAWRNKRTGWHDSWAMALDGEEHGEKIDWHDSYDLLIREKKSFLNTRLSQGDSFYRLFLSDACLGCACYDKCKFKYRSSSSDIRIGDAWGAYYNSNEDGVSAAVAFTKKGDDFLKACNVELENLPFDIVAEGQMKTMPMRGWKYKFVTSLLQQTGMTSVEIVSKLDRQDYMHRRINSIKHPINTIRNIIKRLSK